MTPQELKASILQLAIQGKLVEQRPEEGTGEELYRQIQSEKQRLIKSGKIKKDKSLPEINPDEIPFDIPESWKWVRVGDCCIDVFSGKSPVYVKSETPYRIIGQAANQQKGLDFSQVKYTTNDFWSGMSPRYFLRENDVLLNTLGNGTLGRSGIVGQLPFKLLTDGHLFVFRLKDKTQSQFFYYYLQLRREEIEKNANGSTNQTFLSLGKALQWLIPLPPLAEQKRIVAKIEELLPYIDRYEKAWSKLEDFNKRFPGDMQKSLLQMAIQGKLVAQRPEEGTGEELYRQIQSEKQRLVKSGKIKKEKPLPEITPDEIPFDIPESWKWVRWGEVVNIVSARRVHQSDWKKEGIPFYRAREIAKLATDGRVDNDLFVSQELYDEFSKSGVPREGDLMVTAVGTLGKTYIVRSSDKFYYKDASVICFENYAKLSPQYLKYLMESELMRSQIKSNSSGTTVATLTMVRMVDYLLPLPPLAEQKRIVAKLEELLPLCERLK